MVQSLLYLDIRNKGYNKQQRQWLFDKALSGLARNEVLELHSHHFSLAWPTRSARNSAVRTVAFRDARNHLVSQFRVNPSVGDLQDDQRNHVQFFIDGRRVPEIQLVRQVLHVLHRLSDFTPRIEKLVAWVDDVPEALFTALDEEDRIFCVDAVPGLGLEITVQID